MMERMKTRWTRWRERFLEAREAEPVAPDVVGAQAGTDSVAREAADIEARVARLREGCGAQFRSSAFAVGEGTEDLDSFSSLLPALFAVLYVSSVEARIAALRQSTAELSVSAIGPLVSAQLNAQRPCGEAGRAARSRLIARAFHVLRRNPDLIRIAYFNLIGELAVMETGGWPNESQEARSGRLILLAVLRDRLGLSRSDRATA